MIRFIDLFAGIGGIRKGFELACKSLGLECDCLFTSEIKKPALDILHQNHPQETIHGDITKIPTSEIPDFDILLAGFSCQAFSAAGKRLGFMDTRGTMFFEVERILAEKEPQGFLLENVEGLVNHDKTDKNAKMGRTLSTILDSLQELGYHVSWNVLNAKDFGLAQDRKRVYIVGTRHSAPSLQGFDKQSTTLSSILEKNQPVLETPFTKLLLEKYDMKSLYGKSIKDKRGGENNIHSWDLELKGNVSGEQKAFLDLLFKERRKKKWAAEYGIEWMAWLCLYNKSRLSAILPIWRRCRTTLSIKGISKGNTPKNS